jgi:hypothetical protein
MSDVGADEDADSEGAAELLLPLSLLLPHAASASVPAASRAAIFRPLYKGISFFPTPGGIARTVRTRP